MAIYGFDADQVQDSRYYWVGASRDSNGVWVWQDGSEATYQYWASGEPNGGAGECVHLARYAGGQWNDASCVGYVSRYICEYTPLDRRAARRGRVGHERPILPRRFAAARGGSRRLA